MIITNLHHLAAPCLVDIKKTDQSCCQESLDYYLNPAAIIRYEPGGAVITSPTLYASFLFVDEELTARLKLRKFSSYGMPNYVLSVLLEHKIISAEPTSDREYKEMSVEVSGLPTQVLLDVTSFCTCDCITCYHKTDLDSYVPPLSSVLGRISKLKDLGLSLFEITGGEPCSRDDLSQILGYLKKLNLGYYIVTNGEFLVNSPDSLISLLRDGLGVAVSLDGAGAVHDRVRHRVGLYDKMMKGVDRLYSEGVKIYFISTLNGENISDFEKMIAVAKKYNTTVHFRPTINTGAAAINQLERIDVARELSKFLQHPNVRNGLLSTKKEVVGARYYGCGIRKRISVDSHGILYPCVMDRSRFYRNIHDYSASSLVSELEAETKMILMQNEFCRDCVYNKDEIICGGFCRFSNSYKVKSKP
jgi:radical SAM protein with 4Fe4S-binding SPASM domain